MSYIPTSFRFAAIIIFLLVRRLQKISAKITHLVEGNYNFARCPYITIFEKEFQLILSMPIQKFDIKHNITVIFGNLFQHMSF